MYSTIYFDIQFDSHPPPFAASRNSTKMLPLTKLHIILPNVTSIKVEKADRFHCKRSKTNNNNNCFHLAKASKQIENLTRNKRKRRFDSIISLFGLFIFYSAQRKKKSIFTFALCRTEMLCSAWYFRLSAKNIIQIVG